MSLVELLVSVGAGAGSGIVVSLFVWLLRPGPSHRRGGTLDLSPAAARGELDLDWSDPRGPAVAEPWHGKIDPEWWRRQNDKAVQSLIELRDTNRRLEASRSTLEAIRTAHPGIWAR